MRSARHPSGRADQGHSAGHCEFLPEGCQRVHPL